MIWTHHKDDRNQAGAVDPLRAAAGSLPRRAARAGGGGEPARRVLPSTPTAANPLLRRRAGDPHQRRSPKDRRHRPDPRVPATTDPHALCFAPADG
ncbi:hypothetical protein BN6_33630 [Saccharothrix espanaensis DSM 44229]|uniref:Uncharacterized protein n=1 Tax=Saccharothrix espanaensis (strain ATCC 51144 / DSM 44229 / JCM 9112 / NBRC 15066 / NRRL 15764) TaxID=1179773 RepID=K0JSJ7_SACES|nr:hypothetical protein BN6_33630 [Saccharothrix espanaensis DSM 44229]